MDLAINKNIIGDVQVIGPCHGLLHEMLIIIKALKIGAELQLTPHISLDIGYNNANNMSKGMYGTLKYTLGTSKICLLGW